MRSAVAARGLADRAILLGVRRDVPEILGSADILVQSSRRESFGLSVLEAMASGVPAVVSDIPALREATGGEAGVRVPPGDPGALAEALTRLLDDPARRAALAEAGRRRARAFSTDRMARSFTRLLRVLVGAKRAER